ncbi:MAG: LemA family protein [Halanaerobiales bacterium]
MLFFLVIFILVVLDVLYSVLTYNRIVNLDNRIENAWSQIEVQLKRRYDLIPVLVDSVKGYMEHEKETLEKVIQARNFAIAAGSTYEQAHAENDLLAALNSLLMVVENYPVLKADENFHELREELISTENRISFARQNYNDQVMFYNNLIRSFPINFIARIFSFQPHEYFEIEDEQERAKIDIGFSA